MSCDLALVTGLKQVNSRIHGFLLGKWPNEAANAASISVQCNGDPHAISELLNDLAVSHGGGRHGDHAPAPNNAARTVAYLDVSNDVHRNFFAARLCAATAALAAFASRSASVR